MIGTGKTGGQHEVSDGLPEASALLAAYGGGQLVLCAAQRSSAPSAGCAECAGERDQLVASHRVRAEVPYHHASAGLRARVRADYKTRCPQRPPKLAVNAGAGSARAFAGCAATVFAWCIGSAVLEWGAGNDIIAEAVTDHTRATLGNRLTDVASSDQHTVKPWLSARLDYSPPVQDLRAEGFPLVGGRLDYLDRHPVATLVYRYREHTIDVFVRPLPARIASAPPYGRDAA
jgi:anti-sigma factor RsiW